MYHITKKGEEIYITDMEDNHVINTIKLLLRELPKLNKVDDFEKKAVIEKNLGYYFFEAIKRGLEIKEQITKLQKILGYKQ